MLYKNDILISYIKKLDFLNDAIVVFKDKVPVVILPIDLAIKMQGNDLLNTMSIAQYVSYIKSRLGCILVELWLYLAKNYIFSK